jgi:hypothetical protein
LTVTTYILYLKFLVTEWVDKIVSELLMLLRDANTNRNIPNRGI